MAKHSVPSHVNSAQRVLRSRKSKKGAKSKARGVVRKWNKKAAAKTKKTRARLLIRSVNPGVLQVPKNKKVTQLPVKHFEKLARRNKKKTFLALGNLQRWFSRRKPGLSKWAKGMKNKVRKRLAA